MASCDEKVDISSDQLADDNASGLNGEPKKKTVKFGGVKSFDENAGTNAKAAENANDAPKLGEIPLPDTGGNSNNKSSTKKIAKVGMKKEIGMSELADISKSMNQKTPAKGTVNRNFLFLHAGASTLMKTKPKKRPISKPSEKPMDIEDSSAKESIEEKATKPPASPSTASEHSDDEKVKTKNKSKDFHQDPFYCKVCDTPLNSEQTYISHIEGKKHQKKLAAQEKLAATHVQTMSQDLQYVKVKEGCRINRVAKRGAIAHIQKDFDGLDAPCVGLNFVSEIWRLDRSQDDAYYCGLCAVSCQAVTVVSHVIGFKHRLAYMKMFDPFNYEKVKRITVKKSDLTAIIESYAATLEKIHGSGKIKVEEETDDYVPPLETGRCFGEPDRVDPTRLSREILEDELSVLSPRTRVLYMEEAVSNIDSNEIVNDRQAAWLLTAAENLKQSLMRYVTFDPLLKRRIGRVLSSDTVLNMADVQERASGMGRPGFGLGNMPFGNRGPSMGDRFNPLPSRPMQFSRGRGSFQGGFSGRV